MPLGKFKFIPRNMFFEEGYFRKVFWGRFFLIIFLNNGAINSNTFH